MLIYKHTFIPWVIIVKYYLSLPFNCLIWNHVSFNSYLWFVWKILMCFKLNLSMEYMSMPPWFRLMPLSLLCHINHLMWNWCQETAWLGPFPQCKSTVHFSIYIAYVLSITITQCCISVSCHVLDPIETIQWLLADI